MKRKILLFILAICLIIPCGFMFTGCASAKTEAFGSMSEEISYTYNQEENTTKIEFKLNFDNPSIYNLIREDCSFKLYNNDEYLETVKFFWNINVEANSSSSRNCNIVVDGEIDYIEFVSWTSSFDNLWNSYQVWWLIAIIVPVVIALFYLLTILILQLDLEDVVESAVTWIGAAGLSCLTFVPLFLVGSSNWFPFVICLIGVVATLLLCLAMSGLRAILETYDLNPFEKLATKLEEKKSQKSYSKMLQQIKSSPTNRKELQTFSKDCLEKYCNQNKLEVSGNKKADFIDAIILSCEQETTNSHNNKAKDKSKVVTFDDIAGLDKAKKAFREKVIMPFEHPELYEKFGKKSGGGILLYGLPGTGKTMFAEAASNEVDAVFIPIKCSDIKSKWYGESEQKVKEIFKKARKARRAIIFFDEFEAIGSKRNDNSENGNNDLVPEILAEMQGVGTSASDSTIVVIAATNKPWAIDSAFLRPGRFDEKIYIPLPDEIARKKLFELKLKNIPTKDLDYVAMAKLTQGFNGADITEFCEKLKMAAIHKSLEHSSEHTITMEDVLEISKTMKPSVLEEDIEQLKEFENKF